MATIMLNDCLNELRLAQECLKEWVDIDPYMEIFEAESEEVKAQVNKNTEVKEKTEGHIKKAIDALINMIKSVISKIKGFFFGKKLDDKQKEMNAKMQAAKKKNPGIGKKQIKILDTNKFNSESSALEKEAEEALKQLSFGKDVLVGPIVDKISKFMSTGASSITTSIGMEAALQAASSSKEIAKNLANTLNEDLALQEKLKESVGTKEYNKFKKDIEAMGKTVSLRQALLRLRGYKASSLQGAIENTYKQCDEVFSGMGDLVGTFLTNPNKDNGSMSRPEYLAKTAKHFMSQDGTKKAVKNVIKNKRLINKITGNEDIKNVIDTAGKIADSNSKYNREVYKAGVKAQKEAIKKDKKLRKSKNKSNQGVKDAILGTYDDNSTLKNSKAAKALVDVPKKVRDLRLV